MLRAREIEEFEFSKSKNGYNREEVDELLDKIVEDYNQFETLIKSFESKIESLNNKINESKTDANSINTVLISAQKLADSIVADAKAQAEEITTAANNEAEQIKVRTKKALEEIDAEITKQKLKAQAEVDEILEAAARKSEGMILAAKDSVAREQILFDSIKAEVANFKKTIKTAYKEHLESLSALPDEVPVNPENASITIEEIVNSEPRLERFVAMPEPAAVVEEKIEEPEEVIEETVEVDIQSSSVEEFNEVEEIKNEVASGFVVNSIEFAEEEEEVEEEDDAPSFSKGFFSKRK
ncbi:MAG: DivIVA domain-containing protein [Clostridia bacterium]|nr:DivIVA domain-containing protein [Clostridia bacterium]